MAVHQFQETSSGAYAALGTRQRAHRQVVETTAHKLRPVLPRLGLDSLPLPPLAKAIVEANQYELPAGPTVLRHLPFKVR